MEAIKNRLRLSERRFTLDSLPVSIPPVCIFLNQFTDSIDAPRENLDTADIVKSAKPVFASDEYVYDYPRPRRNLLAACV